MDALSLQPDSPLPEDVPTLQVMVRTLLTELARVRVENAELKVQLEAQKTQLEEFKAQLETQKTQLDAALKHRFGHRSERRKPQSKSREGKPPPKRDRHGRAPLPKDLERREVIHDLTESEKLCPCCGQVRAFIGEQATEQLEKIPAQLFVLRTIKRSYACQHCNGATKPDAQLVQTAGPPQVGPIAKGLCGPTLLADGITAKFADHTPLHRYSGQLARCGVHVPCSTLGDWMAQAAKLLTPLYELMHTRLLLSRVIHGDDTGVKQRVENEPHTHKSHLWACIGDADYPYVVFDYTTDYSGKGPQAFLKGYKGYFQADALSQYEKLYGDDKVKHVCCWSHARRKFVAAEEGGNERAKGALELIRKLYAIEDKLPPLIPPSDEPGNAEQRRAREQERRSIRERDAKPVLEDLRKWLAKERESALSKTPLGVALGYATNNAAALDRYLEQGYLAIDNNLSERTLRVIAMGRNNWGVIGSEAGGKTAAVLYSVVGTCKHLGIDPFAYLREALPGLFRLGEKPTGEQLLDWLPDRWLLNRGRDSPAKSPGL
jgi:transposase